MGVAIELAKRSRTALRRHAWAYRALRSVWTPPKSIHQHLYFDGQIVVEVEPGISLRLECHGEHIENELFWRGFGKGWEGNSLKAWLRLVKSARFIADIGANTGIYSLVAKAANPSARVIALEPCERTLARLRDNIALNRLDIAAVGIAASDRTGEATLYDWPEVNQYTASLEASAGGTVETTVRTERLDDLLPRHGFPRLDLVKIDVELHEPAVLGGMREILKRDSPTILIELLTPEAEAEARALLEGYSLEPIPIDDSPDPESDRRNFIATRSPP